MVEEVNGVGVPVGAEGEKLRDLGDLPAVSAARGSSILCTWGLTTCQ